MYISEAPVQKHRRRGNNVNNLHSYCVSNLIRQITCVFYGISYFADL